MRNIIWEFEFIHEILKRNRPVAALGGVAVLGVGLALGRWEMLAAGAFVTLVVAVEFFLSLIFGDRNSN
jgi:hypothetical protein